jgi:hypothetical protein
MRTEAESVSASPARRNLAAIGGRRPGGGGAAGGGRGRRSQPQKTQKPQKAKARRAGVWNAGLNFRVCGRTSDDDGGAGRTPLSYWWVERGRKDGIHFGGSGGEAESALCPSRFPRRVGVYLPTTSAV